VPEGCVDFCIVLLSFLKWNSGDDGGHASHYLPRFTELELLARERRATERRIRQAKFPVVKTMETFDFLAIPSLNKTLVLELARCEFLTRRENVLLGNSGTGKNTHRSCCWPGPPKRNGPCLIRGQKPLRSKKRNARTRASSFRRIVSCQCRIYLPPMGEETLLALHCSGSQFAS
jgi:hypothetical protein